jgi:hypothetical protein
MKSVLDTYMAAATQVNALGKTRILAIFDKDMTIQYHASAIRAPSICFVKASRQKRTFAVGRRNHKTSSSRGNQFNF